MARLKGCRMGVSVSIMLYTLLTVSACKGPLYIENLFLDALARRYDESKERSRTAQLAARRYDYE